MLKSDSNYSNSKFDRGLSAYALNYSSFLKECMLKAGFISEEVEECHRIYQIFATLAVRIELRRLSKLVEAYKSNADVPVDRLDVDIPDSIEEESKMKKAILNFHIDSASFLVKCMQEGKFESEETDECDAMYLGFMSYALQQEIERLLRLKKSHDKLSSFISTFTVGCGSVGGSESNCSSNMNMGSMESCLDISELIDHSVHISHTSHFDVYRASSSQESIAIKVMTSSDEQDEKRIKNEFDVCNKIQHVGLRKALSQRNFNGKQALLLEWVEGNTIKECEKFAVKQFLQVAREIVSTLSTLHSKNIMHGNLTPENIIFDHESKTVKIIGLSLSSKFDGKSSTCDETENERSRLLGKKESNDLCFMSPEQSGLTSQAIDFRSDFYSLGVIFYIMLSGNSSSNTSMASFSEAKSLHVIDISIPLLLSDFVSKLMQKQAKDRYRSMKGVLQ